MTGAGVDDFIDVLMITYNRPDYVALSLPRLLEECDERTRSGSGTTVMTPRH